MSIESLPTRRTGQTIDQDWFNILKRALIVELAPRDSLGVVGPGVANLGDSTNYWGNLYAQAVNLVASATGKVLSIAAPSGLAADTTLTLGKSNFIKSASCGNFAVPTSLTQVTNFSVSLTTTGKAVRVSVQDDGTLTGSNIVVGTNIIQTAFFRGTTQLTQEAFSGASGNQFPTSILEFLDDNGGAGLTTGTYTYSLKVTSSAGGSPSINNAILVAQEE